VGTKYLLKIRGQSGKELEEVPTWPVRFDTTRYYDEAQGKKVGLVSQFRKTRLQEQFWINKLKRGRALNQTESKGYIPLAVRLQI
jgi:hypothetical protein